MWKCPKCGRTFKNTNQDHYCGEASKTIEEYIERQPEQAQSFLRQVNNTIASAIPDAVEKISWSMTDDGSGYFIPVRASRNTSSGRTIVR